MFDQFNKPINPTEDNTLNPPKPAEDIFDNVDKGSFNPLTDAKPDVFQPVTNTTPTAASADFEPGLEPDNRNKKYFMILLGVIGGLLLITAVVLAVLMKMNFNAAPKAANNIEETQAVQEKQEPKKVESATPKVIEETAPVKETKKEVETTTAAPEVVTPAVIDTDLDGLTDKEEEALGTDTGKKDSDSDGLTDKEEVKIYATKPLIADTDSDGYKDGEEVKNGYNPLGKGKLFDVTGQAPKVTE